MKFYKLFLFLLILTVFSCSENDNARLDLSDEEIVKRHYMIEGFQTINACEAANLTYYFGDCFDGTGYEDGIPAAMQLFNSLQGSSFYFTEVDNSDDADIVFNCVNTDDAECGEGAASFPALDYPLPIEPNTQTEFESGGTIGKDINLEIHWDECRCDETELDLCFFMHTVAHEVAHSLGLYHNDIATEEIGELGIEPIHIKGTTTDPYDPNSIINNGSDEAAMDNWCTPACEFNENDIIALNSLYPAPEIIGPDVLCTNEPYEFCLSDDLEGHWLKDNVSVPPGTLINTSRPTNCSTYSWEESGSHIIFVNVCGKTYTKQVTVDPPCLPPLVPPFEFQNICIGLGNTVCYTFNSPSCLESLDVSSSSPKVVVGGSGTTVCLTSIHPSQENVELTVTSTTNHPCGGGTVTWDITANGPNQCN